MKQSIVRSRLLCVAALCPMTLSALAIDGSALVARADAGPSLTLALDYDPAPESGSAKRSADSVDTGLLAKRQTSARVINQCPGQAPGAQWDDIYFEGSGCGNGNSRLDYKITCGKSDIWEPSTDFYGQCQPWEFCFEADSTQYRSTAYCVSENQFKSLSQAVKARETRPVRMSLPGNTYQTQVANISQQVVLTGQGGTPTLFQASHISMAAQDRNNVSIGTAAQCDNCNRVSVGPWPANTASFYVVVTLPNANDVAILNTYGVQGG